MLSGDIIECTVGSGIAVLESDHSVQLGGDDEYTEIWKMGNLPNFEERFGRLGVDIYRDAARTGHTHDDQKQESGTPVHHESIRPSDLAD